MLRAGSAPLFRPTPETIRMASAHRLSFRLSGAVFPAQIPDPALYRAARDSARRMDAEEDGCTLRSSSASSKPWQASRSSSQVRQIREGRRASCPLARTRFREGPHTPLSADTARRVVREEDATSRHGVVGHHRPSASILGYPKPDASARLVAVGRRNSMRCFCSKASRNRLNRPHASVVDGRVAVVLDGDDRLPAHAGTLRQFDLIEIGEHPSGLYQKPRRPDLVAKVHVDLHACQALLVVVRAMRDAPSTYPGRPPLRQRCVNHRRLQNITVTMDI